MARSDSGILSYSAWTSSWNLSLSVVGRNRFALVRTAVLIPVRSGVKPCFLRNLNLYACFYYVSSAVFCDVLT